MGGNRKSREKYEHYLERKIEERTKLLTTEHKKLKDLFLQTIKALSAAIEAKDKYTHNHSERVGYFSVLLAKAMDLDADDIRDIEFAGILHDIGKISVDEKILNKPDALTETEYRIVKNHPLVSAKIISSISELSRVATYIRHHHEFWNGKGYPDRLKGKQIPLGSRIIAIADAYDTMALDRSYRRAIPPSKIIEELQKGAGEQFDPKAVSLFIKLI